MIVIGLAGKSRHGKDSVADEIISYYKEVFKEQLEKHPNDFVIKKYAFADELKKEVNGRELELCKLYNLTPDPENGWRGLYQYYGTDVCRKEDEFCWIKPLMTQLYADKPKVAIISDVRFLNEVMWVKEHNKLKNDAGYVIRVERYGFLNPTANNNHASETALDAFVDWGKKEEDKCRLFDYEIVCSDGDLEELRKNARTVFDLIKDDLDIIKEFVELVKKAEEQETKIVFNVVPR